MVSTVPSMIGQFNMNNIHILVDMGYQVDVASDFTDTSVWPVERVQELKNKLKELNVECFQLDFSRNPFKMFRHYQSYKEAVKLLYDRNYSFIHTHTPVASAIIRQAAHKTGTKVVYTAHGFHFYDGAPLLNWLVFYPIEKHYSRFTDVLITINKEDYQNAKKMKSSKVEYIPGIGIDTNRIKSVDYDRSHIRSEFGFNDSDFVFVSIGELSVRKNHKVVIKAIEKIKNNNIKYLIVGMGDEETRLKQLVNDLGVSNRVVFAGYRSDVYAILHSMDGFVFPSLQEGLPVALMEAMASGLPIVCSKIRGNIDLIDNGKGGFLYDCNDIDGFADGMTRIVSGEGVFMGKFNSDYIQQFDSKNVDKKMISIYQAVIVKECSESIYE